MRVILLALLCGSSFAQQPPPTAEQQVALVAEVRKKALDYSKGLADFLCTQVTRRSIAKPGTAAPDWKLEDTLTIRVAYVKQREDYRVIRINDKVVDKSLDNIGGHQTLGEFGSILRDITAAHTQAQFRWERWSAVGSTSTAVLSFRVPTATSHFQTTTRGALQRRHSYRWGATGELEVNRETHQVLRVLVRAEDVPVECPVKDIQISIVYGHSKIGDADFLLPLRSESSIIAHGRKLKAETEFTGYRKFTSETGIKFETLDAP